MGCLVNNFTHLDKRCANDKRFAHPTLAILFQNYNNPAPMLWGNSAGGAVSGVVPIGVDSSLKLFGLDKEK